MIQNRDERNLLRAILCLVLAIPAGNLIFAAIIADWSMVLALALCVIWTALATLGIFACVMGLMIAKTRGPRS